MMSPRRLLARLLTPVLAAALVLAYGDARPTATPAARSATAAASVGSASASGDVDRMVRATALDDAVSGRAGVHRLLASEGAGTYVDELLLARDSVLTRWPGRMPAVRVWVQPRLGADGHTLPHARQVRRAFEEWNDVGLPVRFAFAVDSADADVTVVWTDRFREPISGRTRWVHDEAGWILSGSITLALQHSDGEPLDSAAVRALALHEVGHVIGLDHTRDDANVMAPLVRVRQLSAADAATARLLYRLPPGNLR